MTSFACIHPQPLPEIDTSMSANTEAIRQVWKEVGYLLNHAIISFDQNDF